MTVAYVSVEGVELVSVGIDWPAATGPRTITPEDVADAVRAANDDPLILDPRVKIGHCDPRFNSVEELAEFGNPEWDGDPAFGRAINLRLAEDGMVVVGDLVGVPDWLTDVDPESGIRTLSSAYPSRSIEPYFGWTTAGQRHYRMVIAAVALLGDRWPACQDIEDLELLVTQGPAALAARHDDDQGSTTAMSATTTPKTAAPTAAMSTSVDLVQYLFNWDWALQDHADGVDRWMWWARDIRLDADENGGMSGEVIATDGEGGTFLVPWTLLEDDVVEYRAPERVREDYTPAGEPSAVAAFATGLHAPVKGDSRPAFSARAASAKTVLSPRLSARATFTAPNTTAPDTGGPDNQENTVSEITDDVLIRRGLGLADDATNDEVDAARAALADDGEADETETETAEVEVEEPVAALSNGPVTVDPAALARLQADAAAGRTALERLNGIDSNEARDTYLSAKIADGTIHRDSLGTYELLFETAGAERARAQIDQMKTGVVPVLQRGDTAAALHADLVPTSTDGKVPEGLSLLTPAERAQRS